MRCARRIHWKLGFTLGNSALSVLPSDFEIPKPISTMGIGVDALPKAVIESSIFSGNDLVKLANITNLASTEKVKLFVEEQRQKGLDVLKMSQTQKQQQAKSFLDHEDVESAWYVLLS